MALAKAATTWAPESSSSVWSEPMVSTGASLRDVTLMLKVWIPDVSSPPLGVPPLSLTETLTMAEPFALEARV